MSNAFVSKSEYASDKKRAKAVHSSLRVENRDLKRELSAVKRDAKKGFNELNKQIKELRENGNEFVTYADLMALMIEM